MAGDAKKLYKQLHDEKSGTSPNDFQMLGPSNTFGVSPMGTSPPIASYMRSNSGTNQSSNNNPYNNNNYTNNQYNYNGNTNTSIPSGGGGGGGHSLTLDEQLLNEFSKSCHASIDIVSRKTLFYLISTLNASYQPDYDFSNSPSSEFSKEPSFDFVLKSVENCLRTVEVYTRAKQQLWDAIDREISLVDCDFYRLVRVFAKD